MSATLTRVPQVAAALVALAEGLGVTGLQVVDGPFVGELAADCLVLGFPEGGSAAYDATVVRQPGMRTRLQESWTVHCLLSMTSGRIALTDLRERCADTLAALDGALREHATEDGAWQSARIDGAMQWLPINGPSGSSCNVIFDISGTSLL